MKIDAQTTSVKDEGINSLFHSETSGSHLHRKFKSLEEFFLCRGSWEVDTIEASTIEIK